MSDAGTTSLPMYALGVAEWVAGTVLLIAALGFLWHGPIIRFIERRAANGDALGASGYRHRTRLDKGAKGAAPAALHGTAMARMGRHPVAADPTATAAFDTATRRESPTVFAKRIGLWLAPRHSSLGVLSWDDVVDMAADSYWQRRPHVDAA